MFESPYTKSNGIQWVQGEAGAKSYMVMPNSAVLLMDAEENKFYIKSADVSGMPTIRTFEYTETTPHADIQTPQGNMEEYCTKADLEDLRAKYDEIIARLDTPPVEKKPTTRKKEVVDNE